MRKLKKTLRPKRGYESNLADDYLRIDCEELGLVDIRRALCKVILLEVRSRRVRGKKHLIPYSTRLREKRLKIAKYFVARGGKLSHLALLSRLPSETRWPGMIALVETKGFETALIP